ncbi:MAG TPA: hypothetical protein VFC63_04180 [Blastocatellia bacterium]|nr:hypothetical protein [Blastocatellia bacterium]
MRARPIRARIYTPVVRFGVVSTDWKFILLSTLVGYLIPFFLNLKLWRMPLFLWTGLLFALTSYAFFFFIRIGRKPYWFQHTVRSLFKGSIRRRVLPSDWTEQSQRSWLKK